MITIISTLYYAIMSEASQKYYIDEPGNFGNLDIYGMEPINCLDDDYNCIAMRSIDAESFHINNAVIKISSDIDGPAIAVNGIVYRVLDADMPMFIYDLLFLGNDISKYLYILGKKMRSSQYGSQLFDIDFVIVD